MSTATAIIITAHDLERLRRVVDSNSSAVVEQLESELARAHVVAGNVPPADVVAMNSEVVYEDVATGARRTVRVVYPQDSDVQHGRISVLAPLGSALLGARVGQHIDWRLPRGVRQLRVVTTRR